METSTENIEKTEKEIKKVNIADFDPKDAEAFLPGWEYKPTGATAYPPGKPEGEFEQWGWAFTQSFEGKEWMLTVYSKRKDLRWVTLSSPGLKNELKIEEVNKVEFNHKNGELSFRKGNGGYHISEKGLDHYVLSPDTRVTAHINFQ